MALWNSSDSLTPSTLNRKFSSGLSSAMTVGWRLFNVKDYGAIGNGVADDRSSIQSAIDGAVSSSGGIVYFPPGTYAIGSALSWTESVWLQGAGRDGTAIRAASAITMLSARLGSVLDFNGGIRDLTVNGNNLAIAGVDGNNVGRLLIESARFSAMSGPCIHFENVQYSKIKDCYFSNSLVASRLSDVGGNPPNETVFEHNTFEGMTQRAIEVLGDGTGTGVLGLTVTQNSFISNGQLGVSTRGAVFIQNARKARISKNYFELSAGGASVILTGAGTDGSTVRDNFFTEGASRLSLADVSVQTGVMGTQIVDNNFGGSTTLTHVLAMSSATATEISRNVAGSGGFTDSGQHNSSDGSTIPWVPAGMNYLRVGNTGATTITNLVASEPGQMVTMVFTNANSRVADVSGGGNFYLSGATTFVPVANDSLTVRRVGTDWFETGRSYGTFTVPGISASVIASSSTTAQSGATASLGQGQLVFSVLSLTSNGGEFGFRSGNTVYRFFSDAVG